MTLEEINQLDIVDYLATMNIQPKQKQGQQYWYISPLREPPETKPSFKVNRNINRWWDFGLKEGSTLIDFILRYQQLVKKQDYTFRDIKELFAGPRELTPYVPHTKPDDNAESSRKIEITRVIDIQSPNLYQYLKERRIDPGVARQFNKEVHYRFSGDSKEYYALGLPNDAGGWELRNKYHKYTAGPKGPTTIVNGSPDVAAFEGNFNMLTLAGALQKGSATLPDFHITNSAEHIQDTLKRLEGYRYRYYFFDNDRQGTALTTAAIRSPYDLDMRDLYKRHNDLNEWAQNIGKISIPSLGELPAKGQTNDPNDLSPGQHLLRKP